MIVSLVAIAVLTGIGALPEGGVPTLESNPPVEENGAAVSENGYYQISWHLDGAKVDSEFVLEESPSPNFAHSIEKYRGVDRSTTFSGRLDGTHFYRVKTREGPWSQPLKVVIQHHSLNEALVYLAAGGLVFLSTAALILIGHIYHRKEGHHRKEGLQH
jgi:hypothetical protein